MVLSLMMNIKENSEEKAWRWGWIGWQVGMKRILNLWLTLDTVNIPAGLINTLTIKPFLV